VCKSGVRHRLSWLGGGKFFRLRGEPVPEKTDNPGASKMHGVKHFWLCEDCSHVFTLAYAEGTGLVLQLLWPELPLAEVRKELSTAYHT
jgi:hypothetical protein